MIRRFKLVNDECAKKDIEVVDEEINDVEIEDARTQPVIGKYCGELLYGVIGEAFRMNDGDYSNSRGTNAEGRTVGNSDLDYKQSTSSEFGLDRYYIKSGGGIRLPVSPKTLHLYELNAAGDDIVPSHDTSFEDPNNRHKTYYFENGEIARPSNAGPNGSALEVKVGKKVRFWLSFYPNKRSALAWQKNFSSYEELKGAWDVAMQHEDEAIEIARDVLNDIDTISAEDKKRIKPLMDQFIEGNYEPALRRAEELKTIRSQSGQTGSLRGLVNRMAGIEEVLERDDDGEPTVIRVGGQKGTKFTRSSRGWSFNAPRIVGTESNVSGDGLFYNDGQKVGPFTTFEEAKEEWEDYLIKQANDFDKNKTVGQHDSIHDDEERVLNSKQINGKTASVVYRITRSENPEIAPVVTYLLKYGAIILGEFKRQTVANQALGALSQAGSPEAFYASDFTKSHLDELVKYKDEFNKTNAVKETHENILMNEEDRPILDKDGYGHEEYENKETGQVRLYIYYPSLEDPEKSVRMYAGSFVEEGLAISAFNTLKPRMERARMAGQDPAEKIKKFVEKQKALEKEKNDLKDEMHYIGDGVQEEYTSRLSTLLSDFAEGLSYEEIKEMFKDKVVGGLASGKDKDVYPEVKKCFNKYLKSLGKTTKEINAIETGNSLVLLNAQRRILERLIAYILDDFVQNYTNITTNEVVFIDRALAAVQAKYREIVGKFPSKAQLNDVQKKQVYKYYFKWKKMQ